MAVSARRICDSEMEKKERGEISRVEIQLYKPSKEIRQRCNRW